MKRVKPDRRKAKHRRSAMLEAMAAASWRESVEHDGAPPFLSRAGRHMGLDGGRWPMLSPKA
eukprot:447362-Prymnesium_polylepis.1